MPLLFFTISQKLEGKVFKTNSQVKVFRWLGGDGGVR